LRIGAADGMRPRGTQIASEICEHVEYFDFSITKAK